jgi:hypothetical protein
VKRSWRMPSLTRKTENSWEKRHGLFMTFQQF